MAFEELKERHASMWGSAPFERIAGTLADMHAEIVDAETLQYQDGGFDIVTSSVGAIFAPDHRAVASELARVCRPGGSLALSAWSSGGSVDEFFRIIGSYAPPPPPGAGVAASWGEPGYAEGLLGGDFELTITPRDTPWNVETAEEMWTEMSEAFGPIKTLLRALPTERGEALKADLLAFFEGETTENGISMERPYLLIAGTRHA